MAKNKTLGGGGTKPPAPGTKPPAPKPPAPGIKPPAPKPPAPGIKPPAPGIKPPSPGIKPPSPGIKPPSPGIKPPAPGGPIYDNEIVQISIRKYCAVELLNALIIALGIVPPLGKKGKGKGGKKP